MLLGRLRKGGDRGAFVALSGAPAGLFGLSLFRPLDAGGVPGGRSLLPAAVSALPIAPARACSLALRLEDCHTRRE